MNDQLIILHNTFSISVGDKIKIKVESNTEINYLIYKVIGGSNLIDSKIVRFSPTKEYILKIKSTPAMDSSVDVLVYYISEDGELVSDKVDVNIDHLKNHVSNIKLEQSCPTFYLS